MRRVYSRLYRTEEQKNIKGAYLLIFISVTLLVIVIIFGLPTFARFASFLTDFKKNEVLDPRDKTPPGPPSLDIPNQITNNDKISLSGSAEAGTIVTINLNDENFEVTADNDGNFTKELTLDKGNNLLFAKAKDKNGNESSESKKFSIILDKEPPDLEISNPKDEQNFYGDKQKNINVEGNTEADGNVYVSEKTVIINSSGNFSTTISLNEGANTIEIKSIDKAGNETVKILTVNYNP